MPRVLVDPLAGWLLDGRPPQWPRPPDPHPDVSLVAWAWAGAPPAWAAYLSFTDVDSWMARSRGGRLAPRVLYTRWVSAELIRPAAGESYSDVPRLRLHGPPATWPTPAVGPDGRPWYGEHRVYAAR